MNEPLHARANQVVLRMSGEPELVQSGLLYGFPVPPEAKQRRDWSTIVSGVQWIKIPRALQMFQSLVEPATVTLHQPEVIMCLGGIRAQLHDGLQVDDRLFHVARDMHLI